MSQDSWSAVDEYVVSVLIEDDSALSDTLAAQRAAGLPEINVSPPQGKLLMLIAQLIGARRILEVGTLGGYSTIWMCKAVGGGGHVLSLEIDPKHAEVAAASLARAGFGDVAEVRVGPAIESLKSLVADGTEPYDLVFIDADKPSNPDYFEQAMRLTHPDSVIIVDNVVRNGALGEAGSTDPAILGVKAVCSAIEADPRVTATAIQTVGSKGYDGFLLARVL